MLNHNEWPANKRMTIVTPHELCSPWQSVHAFPTVAGRLAARGSVRLICRQDERADCLGRLNDLMQSPPARQRAHAMLMDWEAQTAACLGRLIATEMTPLLETEVAGLLDEVEQALAQPPTQPGVAGRFHCSVKPAYAAQEITGLGRQLAQLRRFNAGLEKWPTAGPQIRILLRATPTAWRRRAGKPSPDLVAIQGRCSIVESASVPLHHLFQRRGVIG